jgi:hypothetical protein
MQITQTVPAGAAIQLARLAHFADLDMPEAVELKFTGYWILGAVGDPAPLWEALHDDAIRLWHLISDDWDDRDLDELPEVDYFPGMAPQVAESVRYARTRTRLECEIEHRVWLARYDAMQSRLTPARGAL